MSLSLTPIEITCADVNDQLRLTIIGLLPDQEPIAIDAVGAHCYFIIEIPNFTRPLSICDHYEQFQKELFAHTDVHPIHYVNKYGYKMYTYHKPPFPSQFLYCYFKSLESMTRCRKQLSKQLKLPNFGTFKLNMCGGNLPYTDSTVEKLIGVKRRYPLIGNMIDLSDLYPEINKGKITKRALK